MTNTIKNTVIFATGVATGSFLAWKLLESKYEKRYRDDVKSVKEAFSRYSSVDEPTEPDTDESPGKDVSTREEYGNVVADAGYSNYSNATNKKEEGGNKMIAHPYVISPEDFGDYPDYDTATLFYYADGYVADDDDELVDDVDNLIGADSLNHFGEYEDDSVFVRNETIKTDYEILMSEKRYYGDVIINE